MDTKPRITVSTRDVERLEALLESPQSAGFAGKNALAAELMRAEVVEPGKVPPDVVTMNSTVRFAMDTPPQEFQLTLVYPRDADNSNGKISVLAPVGSALLGLSVGDEIEWPRPDGGSAKVRIVEVVYQPERAGEMHR